MAEPRPNRRLAAILAADVVGYSRMMASDEAGTLAALKRHREVVFDPAVAGHSGRIVKLIGDGALVEFRSVVDAVQCALAIQIATPSGPSDQSKITLRIGINLGDVIIEGDDIYGDGINIAARLEPLAEPGGICIASIVHESVGNRIDVSFEDGGEVSVKNIDRPVRIFKWHPGGTGVVATSSARAKTSPQRQEVRPSLAVLPFDNMSGDPDQEYFSDGITEDIITDLSKVGGLLVIARNSSFSYKRKNIDIRVIGRELGVSSVLEGSFRRSGNRVRITAQLVDTGSGSQIWAERYDRDLTEIFALQDDVTQQIVEALRVTLTPKERALVAAGGPIKSEAHDNVLRARELLLGTTINRETFDSAVVLLNRAIEVDPEYSQSYASLAMAYDYDFHNRWTEAPDQSLTIGQRYAQIAIEKDPNDPLAHYVAGVIAVFTHDLDRAKTEFDRALELRPNYALALNARGFYEIYAGNSDAAIPFIERAIRLDPGYAQQYLHFLGIAYLLLGKFEAAAAFLSERVLLVADTDLTRAFCASALGHLGRIEEARRVWAQLMAINPKYSFSEHMSRLPFQRTADSARIWEGIRKAGLTE